MKTSNSGLDTKEFTPSRKSHESQTDALPDVQPIDHGENAIPSKTTGEPATEKVNLSHLVATEDYSVFTVGQKRAIIFAGSFAAWFSPMVRNTAHTSLRTSTDISKRPVAYTSQHWIALVKTSVFQTPR
jgi:hypothetical protein